MKLTCQASESSVNRTLSKEIYDDLQQIDRLMRVQNRSGFKIGDIIVRLVDEKGLTLKDVATNISRKKSTLSEYYHAAKLFPAEQRDYQVPISTYVQARRMAKRYSYEPQKALNIIRDKKLSQSRDVGHHFGKLERERENAQALSEAPARWAGQQDLINHCHLEDCRNIISKLKDRTVKVCPFDPPYGQYLGLTDGHYGESGATPCECDNAKTADALQLMKDVLVAMEPKLASDGVILLFRPSGNIDPYFIELTQTVKSAGLAIAHELVWDKATSRLGNGRSPYTVGSERIWVIKRQGDELLNHDGSTTTDVLKFAPVHQNSEDESHYFMKPMELCEFLIKKHSYEGELIFDACGCTGNFSIAAHQLNRKFVYSEINKENYEMGSARVYQGMTESQAKVG